MLIRFNVANFLSFDKETEFNMLTAASLKTHKEHVCNINKNVRVLKTSVIYGANGCGKTNFIKALQVFQECIVTGKLLPNLSSMAFNSNDVNQKTPTQFEIEFSLNESVYTYGIRFCNENILEEWFYKSGMRQTKTIFRKEYATDHKKLNFEISEEYATDNNIQEYIAQCTNALTPTNELFISRNKTLQIKEIDDLVEWVNEKLVILKQNKMYASVQNKILMDDKCKKFTEEFLKALNIGIESIEIENETLDTFAEKHPSVFSEIDEIKAELDLGKICQIGRTDFTVTMVKIKTEYIVKKVYLQYRASEKNFLISLHDQSEGIKCLLSIIPFLDDFHKDEKTFVIDKLDNNIHPILLQMIIRKLIDSDQKSQLIFTTHDSSLLNTKMFRTDEICFFEKNIETLATQIYTLDEFKPRAELDIEKGYLNGRFGAIPFTAKLEDLNWDI